MPTGTVKFYHDRKGYGFLESDASDEDVFFHVDDLGGPEPREGQQFEFEIERAPRGPRATDLKPL